MQNTKVKRTSQPREMIYTIYIERNGIQNEFKGSLISYCQLFEVDSGQTKHQATNASSPTLCDLQATAKALGFLP